MTIVHQALFDTLIGPTLTRTEIAALPNGPYWLNGFDVNFADQWTRYTYNGNPTYTQLTSPKGSDYMIAFGNYYGRDHAYAAMYKMSGYSNQTYLDRATQLAQYHFDSYFSLNPNGVNPFQQMNMSMALLYAITGDEAVRTAFGNMAEYNAQIWYPKLANIVYTDSMAIKYQPASDNPYYVNGVWVGVDYPDPRSRARPFESFLLADLMGAPSPDLGFNWNTYAQNALTQILAGQDPTGTWRDPGNVAWQNWLLSDKNGVGGWGTKADPMLGPTFAAKPFEAGMIHDAFQMYYDMKIADSRIPPAMLASMNYMQNGGSYTNNTGPLYVTAQKCYKYVEFAGHDEGYSVNGSTILNGFLVNNAAFLYRQGYGDAWKTLAENLMSVIVPTDLVSSGSWSSKEPNQVYSRSYKAWPMLYGTLANPKHLRGKWR